MRILLALNFRYVKLCICWLYFLKNMYVYIAQLRRNDEVIQKSISRAFRVYYFYYFVVVNFFLKTVCRCTYNVCVSVYDTIYVYIYTYVYTKYNNEHKIACQWIIAVQNVFFFVFVFHNEFWKFRSFTFFDDFLLMNCF